MVAVKPAFKFPAAAAALLVLSFLYGCDPGPSAPDTATMTTSPLGVWSGKQDSGTKLTIESSGTMILMKGGSESTGTYKVNGGVMTATFPNGTFDMPFKRDNMSLSITLPGDSAPTEFGQE